MLPQYRWFVSLAACFALGLSGAAHAQSAAGSDPSPFAPGDLKRPMFDTRTPVFDGGNAAAKSAATGVAEVDGRAITLGDVRDAIAGLPPAVRDLPFADIYPGVVRKLIMQQALVI